MVFVHHSAVAAMAGIYMICGMIFSMLMERGAHQAKETYPMSRRLPDVVLWPLILAKMSFTFAMVSNRP